MIVELFMEISLHIYIFTYTYSQKTVQCLCTIFLTLRFDIYPISEMQLVVLSEMQLVVLIPYAKRSVTMIEY